MISKAASQSNRKIPDFHFLDRRLAAAVIMLLFPDKIFSGACVCDEVRVGLLFPPKLILSCYDVRMSGIHSVSTFWTEQKSIVIKNQG